MDWYMALLPVLLIVFGASWLTHLAKDLLEMASSDKGTDVAPVEVVNIHDLRR